MRTLSRATLLLFLVLAPVGIAGDEDDHAPPANPGTIARAQPKLLRIAGRIDGSGRIVFTNERVHYVHRHWGRPDRMVFDGEPWADHDTTPAAWTDVRDRLDLTRAWIVERSGRDVIALERTAVGFDLYLCDSPNGGDAYSVTIAIPRR
jgi:hypothetical protein